MLSLTFLQRFAEIEATLELEKEHSKTSWGDLFSSPGLSLNASMPGCSSTMSHRDAKATTDLLLPWSGYSMVRQRFNIVRLSDYTLVCNADSEQVFPVEDLGQCRHHGQPYQERDQLGHDLLGLRQCHGSGSHCTPYQTQDRLPCEFVKFHIIGNSSTNCSQMCTTSLLLNFTGWTVASARYAMDKDQASSRTVIA